MSKIDKEWLRTLYAEAWKQYSHEDSIVQTRGTIFAAIFSALVATIAVLSIQIVRIPCTTFQTNKVAINIILLGIFWILSSFALQRIITAFEDE